MLPRHSASIKVLQCATILMIIGLSKAWQDYTTCGKWPLGSIKIVGGDPSDVGEWPWMVKSWQNDPKSEDGSAGCGASLIHEEWILTAAHCIDVLNEPSFHYQVMGTNTTVVEDFPDSVQIIRVSEVYMHPNYTTWRAGTLDWDIVVMKLEKPAKLSQFVYPVCLPTADMGEDNAFPPGLDATITGWGTTEQGGAQNPDLHKVTVPIVSQKDCKEFYANTEISERMICAGIEKGGLDSCQGDSGGPMVAKPSIIGDLKTRWFQPGIVSWGYGCAVPEYPGVYSRVSAFQDWLAPIFDNGTGPTEKYGDKGCRIDEFKCKGLLCFQHASRCDGRKNCYGNLDEYECGTYVRYFDPKLGKRIKTRAPNVFVESNEECARQCLSRREGSPCLAFDTVKVDKNEYNCYLAVKGVETEDVKQKDNEMHYQLLLPPDYGVKLRNFDQAHNFMITPSWMFQLEQGTNESSWFIWNIEPAVSATRFNSILLNFAGIRSMAADKECREADNMNMVIIRSDVGVSSPVQAAYCLNELPSALRVMSSKARVEFYSADPTMYGFVGEYVTDMYCDNTYTTSPGVVTSPNYPSNYPPRTKCDILIQAPPGIQIELNITRMLVQNSTEGKCNDSVTLYDGPDSESLELVKYCMSQSDKFFFLNTSSSNSFFIVFISDNYDQKTGFRATYRFLTGPTKVEILETSLKQFKYGMTAMGIFFACLTMVFVVSIITITGRKNAEMEKVQKLEHRQSIAEMIETKVASDNIDWDKPSTSQAGSSGSSGSQARSDNFTAVNEVEGKTNPGYE